MRIVSASTSSASAGKISPRNSLPGNLSARNSIGPRDMLHLLVSGTAARKSLAAAGPGSRSGMALIGGRGAASILLPLALPRHGTDKRANRRPRRQLDQHQP